MGIYGSPYSTGYGIGSPYGLIANPIDPQQSWLDRLARRLYEQFREKTKIGQVVEAIAFQTQALEDAAQELTTLRSIDESVGAQLDSIGRILDQPRGNVPDDATYRLFLKAKVWLNRSSGTPEQIMSTLAAAMGGVGSVLYRPEYPAAETFRLDNFSIDSSTGTNLTAWRRAPFVSFISRGKVAGVRAILEHSSDDDPAMFFTARGSFQYGQHDSGSPGVILRTGDPRFPSAGHVVFDRGCASTSGPTTADAFAADSSVFVATPLAELFVSGLFLSLDGGPPRLIVAVDKTTGQITVDAPLGADFPSGSDAALVDTHGALVGVEETVAYIGVETSYAGFGFLSRITLASPLTYAHLDVAPVALVESKGLGFNHVDGSNVYSDLGGKLAGAVVAP